MPSLIGLYFSISWALVLGNHDFWNFIEDDVQGAEKEKPRVQTFTSLKADLHQGINAGFSVSRCLNGTFP